MKQDLRTILEDIRRADEQARRQADVREAIRQQREAEEALNNENED